MKMVICLFGGLVLLLTAGCEVESGYGGAYGVYGEYPYTYSGEDYGYYPAYPAPYDDDDDDYWRGHEHWEHHDWRAGEEMEHPDWR